jgi:hypothetical protein
MKLGAFEAFNHCNILNTSHVEKKEVEAWQQKEYNLTVLFSLTALIKQGL